MTREPPKVVVVSTDTLAGEIAHALRNGEVTVYEHVRENNPDTAPTLNVLPKSFGSGHANRHERRKAAKLGRALL